MTKGHPLIYCTVHTMQATLRTRCILDGLHFNWLVSINHAPFKVLPPRGATKEFEPIARNSFDSRWGISFLRFTNHYCVDELLFCRRHIAGRSESNGCRAVIGRLAYLDQRPCSRLAEEQDQLETRSADWAGGGGGRGWRGTLLHVQPRLPPATGPFTEPAISIPW